MQRAMILAATAALTACATPKPAPPPVPQGSAPLASGLDLAGFDHSVRPQDDLFAFANGRWLSDTRIPPGKANYGILASLGDDVQARLRAIAEEMAASPRRAQDPGVQKIGDFYTSFMDTARLGSLGLAPLGAELARIAALRSSRDIYAYLGHTQRLGVPTPMRYFIEQDPANAEAHIGAIEQGGLSLPNRDFYLQPDARSREIREDFARYVEQLLALSGESNAAGAAKRISAMETRLANHQWSRVVNRGAVRTYNKIAAADAHRWTGSFDWEAFLTAAGAPAGELDLNQPTYLRAVADLIRSAPIDDWRLYFRYHLIDAYAPYLSEDYQQLHFKFHERRLRGTQEPLARWKRAIGEIDSMLGELLGEAYVDRHFAPQSRERALAVVGNVIGAFEDSIDQTWMTPATRARAKAKLGGLRVKIGYPDARRNYAALRIDANDLVGNVLRARAFEFDRQLGKLGAPLDRDEWSLTPQTINAYYQPSLNEIVFPAAILQPPFFDPLADPAVNYGALGAVIGHELSHAFDDQGRKYDGAGNLRDWWTAEDAARFKQRTHALITQYNAYTMPDGRNINGALTLGENIGDLSGLVIAHRAYQSSLGGATAPIIDGFTGEQRFLLGWAQIWRRKYRDNDLIQRLATDPHSPSEFRCNGTVSNLDAFHAAFAVKSGDRLFRAASERVRIW